MQLSQPTYFEARRTEAALCRDFPADALFIDGLHAMQLHFQNTGRGYFIPVLKVMNTAHQLIAHMLMHPDRVEQRTYDLMAYKLQNEDMKLMMLSLIVLIAMVTRTDGARAHKLRSAMLDERSDDFYEGLSLYEQFIEQSELYFREEDFLIDVAAMALTIRTQNETIQRLQQQNNELMEKNEQRNAPIINVAGNYIAQQNIDIHDNQHCNIYATEPKNDVRPTMPDNCILIPAEGKYTEVRRYIDERQLNDPDFKIFCETHSRVELCQRLTREFGWVVDDHSLGRNINRNR